MSQGNHQRGNRQACQPRGAAGTPLPLPGQLLLGGDIPDAERVAAHGAPHTRVGSPEFFCPGLKVGTVWHSMAHPTCGMHYNSEVEYRTAFMGAIL